jgi:hypothetical protein
LAEKIYVVHADEPSSREQLGGKRKTEEKQASNKGLK